MGMLCSSARAGGLPPARCSTGLSATDVYRSLTAAHSMSCFTVALNSKQYGREVLRGDSIYAVLFDHHILPIGSLTAVIPVLPPLWIKMAREGRRKNSA